MFWKNLTSISLFIVDLGPSKCHLQGSALSLITDKTLMTDINLPIPLRDQTVLSHKKCPVKSIRDTALKLFANGIDQC